MKEKSYGMAMFYMVLLFFMWGFLTELDGALIPYLKGLFDLSNFQAALVQFAFFIAFFLMSLPSSWILNRIGYRKGIVLGLVIMAVGSWLFLPASHYISYGFFLSAIFVLASGVTLLQVAANPYVARLGNSDGASGRLNLSQGFNSIAKVIAPLVGSYFILRGLEGLGTVEQAKAVQVPYLILGGLLFALAVVFMFIKLPEVVEAPKETGDSSSLREHPQLIKGIGAIFLYVGAEVTIATFLVIYLSEQVFPFVESLQHHVQDIGNKEDQISKFREVGARYLPFYWGGLMIGRLAGSYILRFIISSKLLLTSALGCIALMIGFLLTDGLLSMWLLIGTGLFLSIMWSNIFTLAIDGLDEYTSKGSGLLIMAIVGGAVLPPLQGLMADGTIGLQLSFAITLISFLYIAWYGWKGHKH